MCSSSPARTPKLQLAAIQWLTGEMFDPTKKIPHVQGQMRSPRKTVGGVKSCLESNPIPSTDAQGFKQTLCTPGPRDPTKTEPELCLSISCRGMGQEWPNSGMGTLGAADLDMA